MTKKRKGSNSDSCQTHQTHQTNHTRRVFLMHALDAGSRLAYIPACFWGVIRLYWMYNWDLGLAHTLFTLILRWWRFRILQRSYFTGTLEESHDRRSEARGLYLSHTLHDRRFRLPIWRATVVRRFYGWLVTNWCNVTSVVRCVSEFISVSSFFFFTVVGSFFLGGSLGLESIFLRGPLPKAVFNIFGVKIFKSAQPNVAWFIRP